MQLAVLGVQQLQRTGHLLHGLDLGVAADTGDGNTGVHGGHDAGVEQLGLQEDLAVGDGNDVGGNVGGHVAGLRLDDGQSSQTAAPKLRGQLGCPLQKTGVEVEDVAGVGFPSGRTADQQGNGTVGHRVLAQIVVNDQHVLALIHEVFAHGAAGVGSDILHGRQLGSGGGDHDGIVHSAAGGKAVHDLRHGGTLLTDGNVNADAVLALLVQNGVGGDGGFAGLAVADDQLTLTAADGNHGVDGLDTGLQGAGDVLPLDDTGGGHFDGAVGLRLNAALAVDGLAQGVDNAPDELFAHGDGHDSAGALDGIAFLNALIGAEDDDGDGVLFQILGHAVGAVGKFHQLTGHALFKTRGLGNAVAYQNDDAGFADFNLVFVIFDLAANDFRYFFGFQFHTVPAFSSEYGFVQQFPDGVQAMGHGVIQALTVIVQADTAQDCGINAIVERDRLSGDLAQLSCELFLLRRGESYGGDGRHLQNAVIPVVQFGKSVTAVGKVADIAPFRQDFHKIQNIGMHRAAEAGV